MFTVRRLLIQEYPKYRAHLKALDEDSKLLRFGHRVSDEVIDHLCDGIEKDTIHHILFCIENKDLDIVAVGHIATRDGMELAFSVFKEYQGQGIGRKLMAEIESIFKKKGIKVFELVAHTEKGGAREFYKRLNYKEDKSMVFMQKKK